MAVLKGDAMTMLLLLLAVDDVRVRVLFFAFGS